MAKSQFNATYLSIYFEPFVITIPNTLMLHVVPQPSWENIQNDIFYYLNIVTIPSSSPVWNGTLKHVFRILVKLYNA